ncbi:cytochrome c-550 [Gracilibacillus halophilus YIM-C55.5]|uniref:Cytochrome c-550 n=1 Tax=Gracilibacillus halophilus YIM-C55.5 TaxID=1308866 RepID=N4WE26_9BACI|nr:cytochrome c [Gracilibacillus halophilus]ENH97494.1 cytochrome c-550 [Gracilibacillus halophilus YIM-C55.5]
MKKNPIIPFAMIAVIGIVAMIVLSQYGLNHQQAQNAEGGEEETVEQDPEAIAQNCIGCHGGDLEGGTGPSLQDVGSKYSQEEIYDIIMNGIQGTQMPGGLVSDGEAEVLSKWLAEKK